MSTGFDVNVIRNDLARKGYVDAYDSRGRKLYLVLSTVLPEHPPGVLIAYEGYGTMFYDMKAPLNKFQLIQKGFTYTVADTLAVMLNSIFGYETHAIVRMPYRRIETTKVETENERNEP